MGIKLRFFMITASPEMAEFATNADVDYIFVDLEVNGKFQRQGHLDTVISKHSLEDVSRVRKKVPAGKLMVRINPINSSSEKEINEVIAAGADAVMLPMFRSVDEVVSFVGAVNGRAKSILLVETNDAVNSCEHWIKISGIDQVHIGLNDLHLDLNLDFMFEPLSNGMLDECCQRLREARVPFGIGGLARVGEGVLPAELLLAEHIRLGSTWAILSRTFHRNANSVKEIESQMNFEGELKKLRTAYTELSNCDAVQIRDLHNLVSERTSEIVKSIRKVKIIT